MNDELAEMSDEDRRKYFLGQGAWQGEMQTLLRQMAEEAEDTGRLAPWLDLWRWTLGLSQASPIVSLSEARALQHRIATDLRAVAAHPPATRVSGLESQLEEFFPSLQSVYVTAGFKDEIEHFTMQYRTAQFYARYGDESVRQIEKIASDLRGEMADLATVEARTNAVLQKATAALASAEAAAVRANDAARAASVAAGKAGTNGLADEFQNFAADHRKASRNYRFWTIAVLVAAVGVATLFVLGLDRIILAWIGAPGNTLSAATDPAASAVAESQRWQAVVYRLAILGGLAGLSAYLGRQAALHRRLHDWGRAVEAQARSFEAFAKQIVDPDTRKQVQLLFSNRVLGSPPEPTAEKTVTRDALQIVADAAMKSRGA